MKRENKIKMTKIDKEFKKVMQKLLGAMKKFAEVMREAKKSKLI